MDTFSFVTVTYSIIIGLAISDLMGRIGLLIRNRRQVQFHWIPIYWAMILFLIQVQIWWSLWGFRDLPRWHIVSFLSILLLTISTYLPANVILPDSFDGTSPVDLMVFFNEHRRAFFLLFALIPLISAFINVAFFKVGILDYGFFLPFAAALLLVSGAAFGSRTYQAFLPFPMTCLMVIFFARDVLVL